MTSRAALTVLVATLAMGVVSAGAAAAPPGATKARARAAQFDPSTLGVYQAEDGQLSQASVITRYGGFEGAGAVYSEPVDGGRVIFHVSVPRASYYTLRMRYGNGSGVEATRSILVDGTEQRKVAQFQNWHLWSTWKDLDVPIFLTQGVHDVALAFNSGDRGTLLVDELAILDRTNADQKSSTSQLMNNWNDLVGIAQSAVLSPRDREPFGPSLAELHFKGDWPTNQIHGEAAYFKGMTDRPDRYPPSFDTKLYFDAGGVLHHDYLDQRILRGKYRGRAEPVEVKKDYIMPPGKKFIIVRYRLENLTNQVRTFDFMDHTELNNKLTDQPADGKFHNHPPEDTPTQTVSWDGNRRGFIADQTRTQQFWFASGSFQAMDSHSTGGYRAGPRYPGDAFEDVVRDFKADGKLDNTSDFTGHLPTVGVQKTVTLDAFEQRSLSFVLSVQGSRADATAAVDEALSQSPDSWATRTRTAYATWLAQGRRSAENDPGVNDAFDVSLVTLKQSQHPEFGSWVAATNPAYDYKVWPRDAAVTALSMEAAGHGAEAGKYFKWMASVIQTPGGPFPQGHLPPGSWYTNYGYWNAFEPIRFVEPELDSTGLFLVGVWKHYEALAATDTAAALAYINDPTIKQAIDLGAHFIYDHIDAHGFALPDQSIWEERFEIATFTQTTYAAGLRAASKLKRAAGASGDADAFAQGAETIRAAILRPANDPTYPGLWYDPSQGGNPAPGCFATGTFHGPNCYGPFPSTGDQAPYFIRGIYPDAYLHGLLDTEVDSSTGLLWVLGLVSANDPKATAHRAKMLRWLGKNRHGISRHENDDFYFSSIYNPGGKYEAQEDSPIWPQPVMYMDMLETWRGQGALARQRLQWYASVTPFGYEPPGEAVDWTNEEPLISTASEPVTAGWFMLATMVREGKFDTRLWP